MNKTLKKAISITLAAAVTVSAGIQTGIGTFAPITSMAFAYPEVSEVMFTDATTNSITVSWKGDANAVNYEVSYNDTSSSNIEYTVAGQTSGNQYTITGLQSGHVYDVRITPINAEGTSGFGCTCTDAKTLLESVHGLKQDTWYHYSKSAGMSWENEPAADGFEYIWKSPSGKTIESEKISQTHYMSFDVKNNNIYKFSLRAYQNINGKTVYTPWETIQVFEQPWVKRASVTKTKKGKRLLQISWYKQNGASGYDVYVSKKNAEASYKKVKSVGKNKTSITLSKFNGKKIKGTYYVYIVSKAKDENGISKSGVTYIWQTGSSSIGYIN